MMNKNVDLASGPTLSELCRVGGIGALIAGVLTVADLAVFILWPQPTAIAGWFALFQSNWLVGLLDFDLLGIFAYVILIPTVLALYVVLKQRNHAWMAIATTFTFVGIAVYFASNTGVTMLSLSGQYAAATTDAQRAMFLAAGQAVLAIFLGSAFTTSFILVSTALLMTAIVMLRSPHFSKRVALVGTITNLAGLGEFLPVPFAIMMTIGVINAIGLGIWFVLLGRRLLQLGGDGIRTEVDRR